MVARHLYRDGLRRDHELTVRRLRNDILSCRINRANRTFRKRCRIGVSIRSRRANRDIAEISVFRRSGKAGNALLLSIISLRVAVRFQRDVLIIVEIDLVLFRPNRDRLGIIRYRRVALGSDGGFRRLCPKRLASNGLGRLDKNFSSVPVVVHRVAQVGSLTINDRLSRIFGQCSFHNGLIRRITGDVRRCYRVLCAMV